MATPQWDKSLLEEALARGAHQSAKLHKCFLRDEFAEMIQKRFWVVLPVEVVLREEGLRLSPLGVVPQKERRPRIICDYTFYNVNHDTIPWAPPEAMQFGHALIRIMQRIVRANPKFGPVLLGKYDLADGYYRIRLRAEHAFRLACLLPREQQETALVAIPLVLPMGWSESPPAFCTATETIVDLINAEMDTTIEAPSHPLLHHTFPDPNLAEMNKRAIKPSPYPPPYLTLPIKTADVYIDDIIAMVQTTDSGADMSVRVLQGIDRVFRPVRTGDHPHRSEPVSVKKLLKGDGTLATRKEILGWVLDTCEVTLEFTDRRYARLCELLDEFPASRKRTSVKKWQQVLGELRFMAPALAGSRGLFGPLQATLRPGQKRLHLTRDARDFLQDFRWLADHIRERPVRLYELFPSEPKVIGATDASGLALGGVFFVPAPQSTPEAPMHQSYLWQFKLPEHIRTRLISNATPTGSISNSDLELAAAVAQPDVICSIFDLTEATIANLHDNTPAVFWQRKGSTTTTGPAAYLLRLRALHQRCEKYVPTHDYIPGPINRMADDASRLVHLDTNDLLTHFDTHYPQPFPWINCTLTSAMNSWLTSALLRRRSNPESLSHATARPKIHGHCGWTTALSWPSTLGLPRETTPYRISRSSDSGTEMDVSRPAVSPSELAQYVTPYAWWDRRTKAWGPGTYA